MNVRQWLTDVAIDLLFLGAIVGLGAAAIVIVLGGF